MNRTRTIWLGSLKRGLGRTAIGESSLIRLLGITAVVFVLMSILNPGRFLTYRNFASMSFQFPELGVLSLAIMISLVTGGIDLSIISVANLAGLAAAFLLVRDGAGGLHIVVALVLALGVSVLCGVLNGWLIGYLGVTPILATLGTMQLFMGIAFVLTKGHAVAGYPRAFQAFGSETFLRVPTPLLVFLACALAAHVLLSRTSLGLRLYMMGTNPTAAVFAGLNVRHLQIKTYALSGLLAGVAGLIIIARTNSAKADYGSSYLLQAVLVAVLAGVDPRGGFGTVWGILLAVLVLQFLSSGLNLLRFHELVGPYINNFTKELTWGALLLLVMVTGRSRLTNQHRHGRMTPRMSRAETQDPASGQEQLKGGNIMRNITSMSLLNLLSICILCEVSLAAGPDDLYGLARIRTGVKTRRVSSYDRTGGNNDRFERIKDGETRELFSVTGAGIINHIWITIAPPPERLNRNDIILRMYWDGNAFPSVESPIGPFFGQGWNESYAFVSLPLAVGPVEGRALVSYFAMPFAKGAKIEVENQTGRQIDAFYYYVDYVELDKLPEDMGRFCAWYNHELTEALPDGENEWSLLGPQGQNPRGERNYLIADIKGKGHFVGVNYYVHCPTPVWYGEGDDMIFIDGSDPTRSGAAGMPTLHGTGTEDYFNTSWCPKTLYSHPYFGYPRVNDDVGWLGRTHLYRFHISDPLYFDKSLKFTIEHGHNNCLTLDLASVAYWYQAPPLSKLAPIPGKEARRPKAFIGAPDMHKWRNEWRKNHGNDDQLWGNEK